MDRCRSGLDTGGRRGRVNIGPELVRAVVN
jgi:hypothetical protein